MLVFLGNDEAALNYLSNTVYCLQNPFRVVPAETSTGKEMDGGEGKGVCGEGKTHRRQKEWKAFPDGEKDTPFLYSSIDGHHLQRGSQFRAAQHPVIAKCYGICHVFLGEWNLPCLLSPFPQGKHQAPQCVRHKPDTGAQDVVAEVADPSLSLHFLPPPTTPKKMVHQPMVALELVPFVVP